MTHYHMTHSTHPLGFHIPSTLPQICLDDLPDANCCSIPLKRVSWQRFGHTIRKHVLPQDPVGFDRSLLDFVYDMVMGDIDVLDLGGVVLHYSKKMNAVARSTTEAEIVGMSEALKQVIWLRKLIAILEGTQNELVTVPMLYGDNKGAVQGTHGTSMANVIVVYGLYSLCMTVLSSEPNSKFQGSADVA
jgi:hypothetical protein